MVAPCLEGSVPILQHDNTCPHTSCKTQEALQFKEVLQHLPYSPNLAPYDLDLFPNMKEQLKGHNFHSDNEVRAVIQSWCPQQPSEFFSDGFAQLVTRWHKCSSENNLPY
ncbi:hypothetical protein JRQ81_017966 [Phrynocephalus forsythii]|uniref:Transposase n=1 Tax=Phrynocephalus forsythii TaxID=171643 RepID=A0A9Q0XRC3_9SAUR|nr:hypothetical protein JRQ81_017966 [Phrynocephalus forsythii]